MSEKQGASNGHSLNNINGFSQDEMIANLG